MFAGCFEAVDVWMWMCMRSEHKAGPSVNDPDNPTALAIDSKAVEMSTLSAPVPLPRINSTGFTEMHEDGL